MHPNPSNLRALGDSGGRRAARATEKKEKKFTGLAIVGGLPPFFATHLKKRCP